MTKFFKHSLIAISIALCGCGGSPSIDEKPATEPQKLPRQVSISFDDDLAIDSFHEHMYLFNRYEAKATIFASKWPLLTKDQLKKLVDIQSSGFEVGDHSMWHVNATTTTPVEWVEKHVIPSKGIQEEYGLNVTSFAYPYGAHTEGHNTELLNVMEQLRGFTSDMSDIKPSSGSFVLAYSIDSATVNLNAVMDAMDNVKEGETLYLASHVIGDWINGYSISTEDLEMLLNYGNSTGITFCSVKDCQ